MPEIDANEVKQLLIASLTGRMVDFARSSEGDGCTRTRHRHLGRRGPCTTLSTGVPIRSAHCSAGPYTLGGVGRWLVLVCAAAVHPIKIGSVEKEPAPNQKKKKQMDLTAPEKKKLLQNEGKTPERKNKTCFGRKRTPHLDLIELHIISQTTRLVTKCTKSRQSVIPVLFCGISICRYFLGGIRYSKMNRYFFVGIAICRYPLGGIRDSKITWVHPGPSAICLDVLNGYRDCVFCRYRLRRTAFGGIRDHLNVPGYAGIPDPAYKGWILTSGFIPT